MIATPNVAEGKDVEIIGKWKRTDFLTVVYTLYRTPKGFVMHREWEDGSELKEYVRAKRKGRSVIVKPVEPYESGDYWVVQDIGYLLVMDSEGLIARAEKLSE